MIGWKLLGIQLMARNAARVGLKSLHMQGGLIIIFNFTIPHTCAKGFPLQCFHYALAHIHSGGYGSCCVCLSVKSHLTFGAPSRPENVTYSLGNRGRKICGVFSETALLLIYGISGYRAIGHFLTAEYARALLKCHSDHGVGFR